MTLRSRSLYPFDTDRQSNSPDLKAVPFQSCSVFLLLALLGICTPAISTAQTPEAPAAPAAAPAVDLPPLPDGVKALDFHDFFKLPVGPLGLEPTARLLSLDQQRVRIVGYMVQEEEPQPGRFMLTAAPVRLAEIADGPADDLPASLLFVQMPPADAGKTMAYRPGRWILTGILQLGQQAEADGRIAYATLLVEPAAAKSVSKLTKTSVPAPARRENSP